MGGKRLLRQMVGLALIALWLAGCGGAQPTPVTGALVGVQVSFGLQDALDQVIEDIDFAGVVVVELDDGTEVNAVCDQELWPQLQGGQKLEVAPIEDSDYWRVVRIVE